MTTSVRCTAEKELSGFCLENLRYGSDLPRKSYREEEERREEEEEEGRRREEEGERRMGKNGREK